MDKATFPPAPRCVLVKYDNVSIEAIIEGSGPSIVMLPSSGRGCDDFDDVAAELAKAGFRVIRPQPRGIGRSSGPMTGITLHDFAKDIAHVIEAHGDGAAVVIGHAFGNWIARCTAVDFPHLVRGVVLAAAAAKDIPPGLSAALGICADASRPADERIKALRQAFFADGHDPRSWLTGWYPETMKSEQRASQSTNPDDWFSGGTAPMLDLQAGADPWRPASSRQELRAALGDRVSVSVVAHASHALFPEQPAGVVAEIVAWVGTLAGRRGRSTPHREPRMGKEIRQAMASEMASLPTDDHVEGPFYRPGAPPSRDLYPPDSTGPVLWFRGRVLDTELEPVAHATLEVWHADNHGRYDNDDPDNLPAPSHFRCRGIMQADDDGTFEFRTVLPKNYKVDQNSDWYRVKHVHFKVYKLGYQPLTTEIALLPDEHARPEQHDDGSPDTLADALFDPKLAAYLEPYADTSGKPASRAYFNFVVMKIAPRGYAVQAARLKRAR